MNAPGDGFILTKALRDKAGRELQGLPDLRTDAPTIHALINAVLDLDFEEPTPQPRRRTLWGILWGLCPARCSRH